MENIVFFVCLPAYSLQDKTGQPRPNWLDVKVQCGFDYCNAVQSAIRVKSYTEERS